MKRLLAVALVCALALTILVPSAWADGYAYRTIGPLKICTGCGATTGQVDSLFKYLNAATAVDTTVTYPFPGDMVIPEAADSMPIIVIVERESAGAATDSIYTALQTGFGKGTFATTPTWAVQYLTQIGANTSGAEYWIPSRSSSYTIGSATSHHFLANGVGAREFRILARSYSAAPSGTAQYSLFLSYPVAKD